MDDKVANTADALQNFDAEGTTVLFGVVPIALIVVFAAIWFVIWTVKKKRLEADLAAAMVDDSDSGKMAVSNVTTRDMQELDSTKPSERLTDHKKTAD